MVRKVLGAKWLISATALVLAVIVGITSFALVTATTTSTSYCAVMNDAVGLFTGNDVTRRGVKVGTITGIRTQRDSAVVRFDIDAKQKLPDDVGAVSVSPSILAVRQLSLMGDYTGGATFTPSRCIPLDRTSTPVTITKSLESVANLSKEITTAGGPQQLADVLGSIQTLNTELGGTGPLINTLIKQLATPARSPFATGLAQVGSLIDNMSSLVGGLTDNWPLVAQFARTGAVFGSGAAPLFDLVARTLRALPVTLGVLAGVISRYQHFVFPGADAVVPIARLVGAGFRNFGDLLGIVPPLIRAFTIDLDDDTLGLRVRYTPPTTLIPARNPALTCANINRLAPGSARSSIPRRCRSTSSPRRCG
ncbi:MlaD family protein [Williamsia sp.]|uniref:MlaD family protein n=1 Tax=Williamsia sp. TaxID=1872085 RepID=UPI0025DAF741|nr:MlaD family protein [Williamsia sp.]